MLTTPGGRGMGDVGGSNTSIGCDRKFELSIRDSDVIGAGADFFTGDRLRWARIASELESTRCLDA